MTIVPITAERPACFGVCCDLHARCARYAAVERAAGDPNTIATCADRGDRPLFVEIEEATAC